MPYGEAQTLFGALPGGARGAERMPTLSPQAAEGLPVLDGSPSRDEIERRSALVAQGRFRRPVVVLGMEGA